MGFNKPTEEMLEKLKAAVPGRVYLGEDISEDFTHDEYDVHGHFMPDAVVSCKTTEEVSAVCKLCYEYEVPIVPRGAGTGLSGGCVPTSGGVVIDLQKMNQIHEVDLDNLVIRAQAGALIDDVQKACQDQGMLYPPDPGEKFATLGGNVATNAGGMRACKYGCTRDWVLAMTVVMPNGDIMRFGAEVSKNCSGYSLMNLMCGSEGTLGIITELSMRIAPNPTGTISFLAPFTDVETCIACVSKVKLANLNPQALEFMDRDNVASVEKFLDKKVYPDKIDGEEVGAYLLVNFEVFSDDEVDALLETAAELFVENGALDVMVYDTPTALANAWLVRGSALEAILEQFELTDECDVVVPISHLAELINYCNSLQDETGVAIRLTGHAGDGNVHVSLCVNDMSQEEFEAVCKTCFDKIYAKGKELGGAVSGEHGIGNCRIDRLEEYLGKEQMDLMVAIKKACDPKMLLNPGKVCYSL